MISRLKHRAIEIQSLKISRFYDGNIKKQKINFRDMEKTQHQVIVELKS